MLCIPFKRQCIFNYTESANLQVLLKQMLGASQKNFAMSCGDISKLKLPRNSRKYFDLTSWERLTTLGI